MANANKSKSASNGNSNLGFEAKLWAAADALCNNMDAAEYKHVVLGLIFLKYSFDAFEAKHTELEAQRKKGAEPEDPDEYRAESIFWVPPEARWQYLKSMAPHPTIGTLVDCAMTAIERDKQSLKGVLPKDFAHAGLDKQRSQIINANTCREARNGGGVRYVPGQTRPRCKERCARPAQTPLIKAVHSPVCRSVGTL